MHSSTLLSFQHLAPELRLFCGENCLDALARELWRAGCCRAVVVTGRSVGAASVMQKLRDALGDSLVGECQLVLSNSPLPCVEDVARCLASAQADACVAIGGGSASVTARAASILLAEGRPARELCTRRLENGQFESPRLEARKLLHFVVATTPSTAFVKAGSAVLDPKTSQRLALFDPKTRAKGIFLHPDFLGTAPAELVRSAALNTLSSAVEALESEHCDPVSEGMLLHALRLTAEQLALNLLDDTAVRERLAIAAVMCGRGTDHTGGGLSSALCHAIGHRSDVANGVVSSIVLPHAMRFKAVLTGTASERICDALGASVGAVPVSGASPSERTSDALESLFARLALPRRLRDIGVREAEIRPIAEAVLSDWFVGHSYRGAANADDIRTLIAAAW